ncbi:MAG: oxidoreductase [Cyanobacteria bacterium RYN_339]|nr:oxidoreductase [Cyanobacteria bacterium RYN_339]
MTTDMARPFSGKGALVVGGSRGIGGAVVRRLAQDGAAVAFTYANSDEQASSLVEALGEVGGKAIAIKADSADASALQQAVEHAVSLLGGLDIVVYNAGILFRGPIDSFPLADFDRMVAINVRGAFVAIKAAVPHMSGGGRIITIGSNTAIRTAFPGGSVYSMTKGAIASLVRGIAVDLAPRGITVNNVQPGPTATDMVAGPETVAFLKPLIPLGRLADPDEIAGMVAYLASREAGFVTGASLTIDGGYVA